jgi:flagellar hook-length control protein FliK
VPDALKRLAREILDSIPQVKNVHDPRQLKKSINNSGLFLETKLAYSKEKNSTLIQADFKAQLLKLQAAFKQALNVKKTEKLQSNDVNLIKEMQQKTESSLARIILNQLTSLPREDGSRQVWILDLPFLNKETADSVKIKINQEKKQENWTVNITVSPPELATIHCKISCFDKTINTRFWSDTQEVVTKITQQLDYLKLQFEKAGINPGQMTAHTGIPNTENYHEITDQSLFDQEV